MHVLFNTQSALVSSDPSAQLMTPSQTFDWGMQPPFAQLNEGLGQVVVAGLGVVEGKPWPFTDATEIRHNPTMTRSSLLAILLQRLSRT
jgi:hypothetical protein